MFDQEALTAFSVCLAASNLSDFLSCDSVFSLSHQWSRFYTASTMYFMVPAHYFYFKILFIAVFL